MITLVSWNVRYFSHRTRGITSTEGTLRRIAHVLADLDPQPDVIALQEIDDISVRSSVGRTRRRERDGVPTSAFDRFVGYLNEHSASRLCGAGHHYQGDLFGAHGQGRPFPLYSTGLGIVFRSTLEQVEHNCHAPHEITFRRIPSLGRIKQKRICAWSRFGTGDGRAFDVFNTHLSLPAFLLRSRGATGSRFGEAENQLEEIERVLSCMDSYGDVRNSVLVGDFNALPGSRVYNRVLATRHLRDAHASYLGHSPSVMAGLPSAGFMRLRYRLDHIFSGPQLSFDSFEHTHPFGRTHPWRGLSDHSPLIARFSVI